MAFDGRVTSEAPSDRKAALLLLPLLFTLIVLVLVFFVLYTPGHVDGPSMLPTLKPEDRLLVTKGYPDPRRGDLIVFSRGEGEWREEFVKRVIGLPGDTIQAQGDNIWVNGTLEPYGELLLHADTQVALGPITVPSRMLFVAGDNRPLSLDSRFAGPVPISSVKGRVVAIFSPVNRMRRIYRFAAQ